MAAGIWVFRAQCQSCGRGVGAKLDVTRIPKPLDVPLWDYKLEREGRKKKPTAKTRSRQAFYRSKEWKRQRDRVLARDGFICHLVVGPDGEICGAENATQAHHVRYSDPIEDTPDSDLISVCEDCHDAHHEKVMRA